MSSSKQPPGCRGLLLFGVIALLIIATLPYVVPMRPVVSDSYIFGYNNRAGIALFVLLSAVVGWAAREKSFPVSNADRHRMSARLMWGGVGFAALFCYGMYRLTAPLNGFAESTYFIQRLHLMAANRVPYRDFEFAYGAALLYLPLWTARVFHLGLTDAYYIVWALCAGFSVILLFETIRLAGDERQDRAGVFLIFCGSSFFGVLNTGLNYVLLRFVLPVYFAVLIVAVRRRERGRWKSSALAGLATVVLLLISPELAVAFAIATLLYFAINTRLQDKPAVIALSALTCVLAALFVAANALGVFSTMRAFSAGGNNFPIYISPTIAVFFAATCTAFVYVAQSGSFASRENVFLYWILLGTVLIPAALGRCDFGHVGSYGLGIYFALGLLLSATRAGRRRIRLGAWLYILLIQAPGIRAYIALAERAARETTAIAPSLDSSQEVLLAPFSYRPNGWGAFDSPSVEYGYYHALTNVLTQEQVQYKVAELKRHGNATLLLPREWASYCVRTPDNSRALLSYLFGVPYIMQAQHEMNLYMPICDYIRANYHYVPPRASQVLGEYDLWAPNRAQ